MDSRWTSLLLQIVASVNALRVCRFTESPAPKYDKAMDSLKLIYPDAELGYRVELGRRAQGLVPGSVLRPTDPEQDRTYGEFDLHGVASILDIASRGLEEPVSFCDVGSGMGRLALFVALKFPKWRVRGLEISALLHGEAIVRAQRAENTSLVAHNRLVFECRDFLASPPTLGDVNCLFLYSTVFPCVYSPEHPYPILDESWTTSVTAAVQSSRRQVCKVITIDRALDPAAGFHIVNILPGIPNRETAGSVAYIHEFSSFHANIQ